MAMLRITVAEQTEGNLDGGCEEGRFQKRRVEVRRLQEHGRQEDGFEEEVIGLTPALRDAPGRDARGAFSSSGLPLGTAAPGGERGVDPLALRPHEGALGDVAAFAAAHALRPGDDRDDARA